MWTSALLFAICGLQTDMQMNQSNCGHLVWKAVFHLGHDSKEHGTQNIVVFMSVLEKNKQKAEDQSLQYLQACMSPDKLLKKPASLFSFR